MAAAMLVFTFAFVSHTPVSADAAGGTGGAGGGSGGAQTRNGWGWYNYSVNGNPSPAGFRWSGSWPAVSSLCASQGADRVIAFIVLKKEGTDASTGVVYDYLTSWDGFSHYNGGAGGGWLQTSAAKALFDTINVDKSVYRWGVNVAWFCFNSNPTKYSLDPSISTSIADAAEPGTAITINPSVNNAGPTASVNTNWRLTSFRVSPGGNVPAGGNSASEPCNFYNTSGVSNCGNASFTSGGGSTGVFNFPKGIHNYTGRGATVPDLPAGTKFCYALSVQPRAQDSSQWRHSTPACVTIGSKPKVHIWGGDLYVGRKIAGLGAPTAASNIQTSTSVRSVAGTNRTWGSWVEYGALASGTITGIGSGSSYAGNGLAGATRCSTGPLTFTNGTNGNCANNGTFGGYSTGQSIPDVASSFPTNGATNIGANRTVSLTTYSGTYVASGTLTITTSNITRGRSVIIIAPTATVNIQGNLRYNNSVLRSISDIPQVVIVARNINIRSEVDQVDAWLIAKATTAGVGGEINTCSDVAKTANLAVSPCDSQLVVNGPVMANKLYLRRTTNTGTGEPAEIFNLRPDAYLWAYARASASARVQTVYSTEMPPRL